MANLWTYEQKFNLLNDGDLQGQDNWVGSTLFDVTSESSYEGIKDLKHIGSISDYVITRSLTPISSGTFNISIKADGTTGSRFNGVYLTESTGGSKTLFFVGLDPLDGGHAGDIVVSGGAGINIIGTYTANTWVRFTIAFECGSGAWEGLGADSLKIKINNGAWSSPYAFSNLANNAEVIRLDNYGSGTTGWFDYISPNYSELTNNSSFFQFFN